MWTSDGGLVSNSGSLSKATVDDKIRSTSLQVAQKIESEVEFQNGFLNQALPSAKKAHVRSLLVMTNKLNAETLSRTRSGIFIARSKFHALSGHENTVCSVFTRPTGPQVITGTHDTTIKFWDLNNGNSYAPTKICASNGSTSYRVIMNVYGFGIGRVVIFQAHKDTPLSEFFNARLLSLCVMVATVRCEEIASDELRRLSSDEYLVLEISSVKILDTYLFEYDMEAFYFDELLRKAKRQQLESKELQDDYGQCSEVVDEVIPDAPYAITEEFMKKLFDEYNIDYIIHGDDPCLLHDGTDAYALVIRLADISRSSAPKVFQALTLLGPGLAARVVYIDGAFDLFHAGHVEVGFVMLNFMSEFYKGSDADPAPVPMSCRVDTSSSPKRGDLCIIAHRSSGMKPVK
ncbi:hypothetical protein RHSIM_Rhsim04G0119500 [Rhododendron simsii]|uniref:Ethanolamine-phosphate cytidylyltransferase n=1 Tax=Rhododendron simsii TaxID=118357 RepID=A0A834H1D1_RHOSS|nr:hypothetical protein RHSIM_Rhsim04G0119500 [Rhododendron simsii]